MISLFAKLQKEKLLKENGSLLDLGSGDGRLAEPFLRFGYNTFLVDNDEAILLKAESNLKQVGVGNYEFLNTPIEEFNFNRNFDGIIISNVLPFQKNKENVVRIVRMAFEHLNKGCFLFFTLFGTQDDWAIDYKDTMSFYTKEESLSILNEYKPYFISEDYGQGSTMKGDMKTWHVFHILYIK